MVNRSTPTPPKRDDRPTPERGATRRPVRIGARRNTADGANSRTFTAAIVAHLVIGFALLRVVTLGHGLYDWFGLKPMFKPVEEHITYVEPAKPKPTPVPVKPKAVTRPVVTQPAPPAIENIATLAPPVSPPVTRVEIAAGGGDSSGTGTGGDPKPRNLGINPALVGIAPANADQRIWTPGTAGINLPRTGQQTLDSIVGWAIASAADSLDSIARLYNPAKPAGDWTKRMKNGEKWGWDQTGLRLGKITVPNALLALLPAGVQQSLSGNPLAMANARRLALSREDINRFSTRAMAEADFKKAVKELRAQKEREHTEKAKKKESQKIAGPP